MLQFEIALGSGSFQATYCVASDLRIREFGEAESFGRSEAYFTALYTIIILLNSIASPNARKIYIYPVNIAWETQNPFIIADYLDPALSNPIVDVFVHTLDFPYLITAKDIIQLKQAFTEYCLKHTRGRIVWIQKKGKRKVQGVLQSQIAALLRHRSFSEKDASDFVTCDRKWCNRLLGNKSYKPEEKEHPSRKHAYIILTPFNPTFI